jgi:hypothetical protein
MIHKLPVLILLSIVQIISVYSCTSIIQAKIADRQKYALLVGGGVTERDNFESYYKNIEYVYNTLKKLGYRNKNIKVLFYGGKTPRHSIVEADATKENFIIKSQIFQNAIDSNDSLLIFRSGLGKVDLVFDKFVSNEHGL